MPTKVSQADGIPDYLAATAPVARRTDQREATDQRPPSYGVTLPLDPMLEAAGAYWNDRRELVRKVRRHAGDGQSYVFDSTGAVTGVRFRTRERHVAPPGMTLEQARDLGLDFYSPQLGWIRAGVKVEREHPDNMGAMSDDSSIEIEAPPSEG